MRPGGFFSNSPQKLRFLIPGLTLLWTMSQLSAQTAPRKPAAKKAAPSVFKLAAVKVTGSTRYKPEQIVAATGLEIGHNVSDDDFKRASQNLNESGAFDNVTYKYKYSGDGAKLELAVSDGGQFVPARFDNVAWFSDQELAAKLSARVPLFQGTLPLAGNLADQVSDALQALLIERNVPGRAEYLRAGPDDGPVEAFVFSVSGVTIRIRNMDFTGAGPEELPLLREASERLAGGEYVRSLLTLQANKDLLPVYARRGYLKASIGEPQPKVVEENPQETLIDITFAVDPGRQYKLAGMEWSGNKLFPTDKLQPLIHLQPGQPADAVRLGHDLDAVAKLYGTRGYVAASVQPVATFDDAQSSVSYELQVKDGDLYHMGDLDIQGLDGRTTSRLTMLWKLQPGDVYDSSYPKRFLDEALEKRVLTEEWNITTHESPEARDKTVDVTFKFDAKR